MTADGVLPPSRPITRCRNAPPPEAGTGSNPPAAADRHKTLTPGRVRSRVRGLCALRPRPLRASGPQGRPSRASAPKEPPPSCRPVMSRSGAGSLRPTASDASVRPIRSRLPGELHGEIRIEPCRAAGFGEALRHPEHVGGARARHGRYRIDEAFVVDPHDLAHGAERARRRPRAAPPSHARWRRRP